MSCKSITEQIQVLPLRWCGRYEADGAIVPGIYKRHFQIAQMLVIGQRWIRYNRDM